MKRQPVTSVTTPMNDKKNNNEKKSLASRLHITFKDEENCKDVWSISMNNTHIIAAIAAIVLIIGSGMFALFVWTPLHNILPGYMKSDTRTQLIDDALRIDSLSYQMSLRDKYMENIARILNDEITIDSISRSEGMAGALDSVQNWTLDILSKSSAESEAFSEEYEKNERFNLTMLPQPSEGIIFYPPLSGKIISTFDASRGNYGIEIQVANNSSVSAALDGTLVAITHTISNGYVIVVQHNNNFVSIYRNIGDTLRRIGDKVTAGEKIALAGTSLNKVVVFELWRSGIAVDPMQYIVF